MSSRVTHPDTEAALDESNIPLAIFAELDFESGVTRWHSGTGQVNWNGEVWVGAGDQGEISEIQEGDELQSSDIQLGLNGVDPVIIGKALSENFQGRPAKIWLGVLDSDYQIVGEPVGPFSGTMDTMDGEVGESGKIILTIKNRLADWERSKTRRYTNEDQQSEYPGDLGMEFVSQMVEKELVW